MKKLSLAAFALALIAGSAAHATLTNISDPYSRATNIHANYAIWDSFSESYFAGSGTGTTYTYSGNPGAHSLYGLSLTQSSPHINQTTNPAQAQGAGLLNSGDVYYSSTRAQNWTLTATSGVDFTEMSFQIKVANVTGAASNLFIPTLNGVEAGVFFSSTPTSEIMFGSFTATIIEYRWSNLDIAAGEAFSITFSNPAASSGEFARKPVDTVVLDVRSVPEPTTTALVALSGIGLLVSRKRRANRS